MSDTLCSSLDDHPAMNDMDARQTLRRQMRSQRRQLSVAASRLAAQQLCRQLQQQLWFQRARHIGLYLPMPGEINPLPAVSQRWTLDHQLYLPSVSTRPPIRMQMLPWVPGEQLLTNKFGVGEPMSIANGARPLWALDLLLIPLLAFDRQGNRLGMGGGYYDRLLATLAGRPRRPRLVGLAYAFQEVVTIPTASWDIPLDLVATEQEVIGCN